MIELRAATYRATRVTSAGSLLRDTGRPGPAVETIGYRGAPMWPRIEDWPPDCTCSRAFRDGRMRVKVASGTCPVRWHRGPQ